MGANNKRQSVGKKKQKTPVFFIRLWGVLLVISIMMFFLFIGAIVYNKTVKQAFLPLDGINLERPLIYGDQQELIDIVEKQKKADQGLDYASVDINKIARDLKSLDWIEKATVTRQWRDKLHFSILERIPFWRWNLDAVLDINGKVFHIPMNNEVKKLFHLYGPEGTQAEVIEFYKIIKPWLNSQGIKITTIGLDSKLMWHIHIDDIDVIVGNNHFADRLKKLVIVNERIINKYKKYIKSIDLRYKDGFSVHWMKGININEQ